jgi:tetratricopeptide (TPR) repeat protein
MRAGSENVPTAPFEWLLHGQALEAAGQLDPAIAAYDQAIATLQRIPVAALESEQRRLLGVAWMNRGNALQKAATTSKLAEAVSAYDAAIALFRLLPFDTEPRLRNHLGAAWLNRGHALILLSDAGAKASFEQAISELEKLPLDDDASFRLNLAGAWTNLAHALLGRPGLSERERSRDAAHNALRMLVGAERDQAMFAAMSLRARRALVMALGELLAAAEQEGRSIVELAGEATDAIDDGLAIARAFEMRGDAQLRPLAQRLFRLGAQLYASHQPQFLGEFVLETIAAPSLAADENFLTIAAECITGALDRLQSAPLFAASDRDAEKLIATARSLRAAQSQLSTLATNHTPVAALK